MNGEIHDYTKLGSGDMSRMPSPSPSGPRGPGSKKRSSVPLCGCLVAAVVVFMVAIVVAAVALELPALMKSNEAYQEELARAQADPRVRDALGEPVVDGWMPTGRVQSGDIGFVDLSVKLKGPKGTGTLNIQATRSAGVWTFQSLDVRLSEESRIRYIDLSNDPLGPAGPSTQGSLP
jgi:hypothetical protein